MWSEAEKFLLNDRNISPLIKKWGSCTIKPQNHKDYFEHLCSDIVGQQLSGKAADTIFERFKKKVINVSPESVLNLSDQQLRGCGLSWAKVSYIKDLAQRAKDQRLKTKNLSILPDEELVKELVAVKGIGRWTAEMFMMFALGRPDVFPLDDLGIQKGYAKVTEKKWDKVKAARYAEKHWKPYRTVASWYLWRSLEN